MDDTTSDISPPTILDGRYRIGALLGSGGMGQVFVGEDLRLGRQVAIKVVRPGPDDATLGERLFREARAAARSDHPAVVTAFGYGSDPDLGVDYFVMERLHGETVGQRIQRIGPLPLTLLLADWPMMLLRPMLWPLVSTCQVPAETFQVGLVV